MERRTLIKVYIWNKRMETKQTNEVPAEQKMPERGTVPYKRWIQLSDEYIMREFPNRPTEELARECGADYYTISRKAKKLGVKKSAEFMRSRWSRGGGRKGCSPVKRTESTDEYMKAHFHDTKNADLAALFGVDVKTVRRWARKLGLQKSDGFMCESRRAMSCYYTPEQKELRLRRIREVYPGGDEEALCKLAEELGVKRRVLYNLAKGFGVHRLEEITRERRANNCRSRLKYTPEIIAAVAAYYPDHTNEECAEKFGIPKGTINQLAVHHRMKKTKEHKHRVYSEASVMQHKIRGHKTKKNE